MKADKLIHLLETGDVEVAGKTWTFSAGDLADHRGLTTKIGLPDGEWN